MIEGVDRFLAPLGLVATTWMGWGGVGGVQGGRRTPPLLGLSTAEGLAIEGVDCPPLGDLRLRRPLRAPRNDIVRVLTLRVVGHRALRLRRECAASAQGDGMGRACAASAQGDGRGAQLGEIMPNGFGRGENASLKCGILFVTVKDWITGSVWCCSRLPVMGGRPCFSRYDRRRKSDVWTSDCT